VKTLADMIWIEQRKAFRSNMPLYTGLGSLMIPLGLAFILFVSRNPEISRKLGLISTKATLLADTAANWSTYLGLFAQVLAMGGTILFVLVVAWVFGREFVDGTLKDLLAVPVPRSSILLAKFIVVAVWSAGMAVLLFGLGLVVGVLLQLPGGTTAIVVAGTWRAAVTACLVIAVMLPFAFFASLGRGYLLPIGAMIVTLVLANILMVAGWGEYFPWSIVPMYSEGKEALGPVSFFLVGLTGPAGVLITYLWWKYADQNR
jgi:ABC-2 type transport system permease protein